MSSSGKRKTATIGVAISRRWLYREFGIEHTTLPVDHVGDHAAEGPRLKFLPRIEKRDTR
jgi:hypothetical protein